jgi:polyisoprenoid-binding protein YceI
LQKPDMFDAEKFPTLTFKSTSITKVSDKKYKLVGDLTIKGVTKSYTLDLTMLGTTVDQRSKKQKVGFKATGTINRTDFGVANMPAMVISNEIELRASGEFVHE